LEHNLCFLLLFCLLFCSLHHTKNYSQRHCLQINLQDKTKVGVYVGHLKEIHACDLLGTCTQQACTKDSVNPVHKNNLPLSSRCYHTRTGRHCQCKQYITFSFLAHMHNTPNPNTLIMQMHHQPKKAACKK
jgi:hypothetical protein